MATQVIPPQNQTKTPDRLSNPTSLSLGILEDLARHEVLNVKQLCSLRYGEIDDTHEGSMRRALRILKGKGFIHTGSYCPDSYSDRRLPIAVWLSKEGATYAEDKWPQTYPKFHGSQRSKYTLEHDLKRADTHQAIAKMCDENKWTLGWKKTDLFHVIKPDDFFEITGTKTARFFLEEENKKKNLKEMYEKLKPYVDMRGSEKFKEQWGFKYFNVIIPMRNREAVLSVLTHFAGSCNCLDPKIKRFHTINPKTKQPWQPFKLQSGILWFTTHDLITKKSEDRIFASTTDFNTQLHSFLDIIK